MFVKTKVVKDKISDCACWHAVTAIWSFLRSVTKRVWSPPQRPFRVCCHQRETRKGITAGTLEELKERVTAKHK